MKQMSGTTCVIKQFGCFFFDKNFTFLQKKKKKTPRVALNLVPDRNKEKCGTS